ncbi:MAG: helix-turn-helix transcriptional regulator [Chitinophagaceae bacterium]|nr:helix-turn-helix transcriptional regulator [Chitinophagaceae bacterium]
MPIHISTPNWGGPCLHPLLPESPSTSAFPDARELQSSGCFSSLLFYDDQSRDFCIRLSNYFLGADAGWFERSSGDRLLVLQFVLHDSLTYKLEGSDRKFMSEGQFNLFGAPSISKINWFDPANSHVDTLDIHFSPVALQKLGDDFPELVRWLGKKDVASTLSPVPATVTPIMLRMLHAIIECPYKDDLRRSFLQSKTAVLLMLALEQLISRPAEPQAGIPLRKYDLEKLYEAREYLLHNIENPPTLKQLAHRVGLNEFKLKKGYKQVFGTTIFGDFNKVRMEEARHYLLETDKSIADISLLAGYDDPPNFIRAFKHYYGTSPNRFRKEHITAGGKLKL